jgi:hypothetical protein
VAQPAISVVALDAVATEGGSELLDLLLLRGIRGAATPDLNVDQ